jgi:hypothetical protein
LLMLQKYSGNAKKILTGTYRTLEKNNTESNLI